MKFSRVLAGVAAALTLAVAGGGAEAETLRIGVVPGAYADAVNVAAEEAKAEGIDVEVTEFSDWTTPNVALDAGDIDVNFFQHRPFQASLDRPTAIGPFAQILHAGIDLGIGQGALAATLPFVRERARPWIDAKVERAADDPLTLSAIGEVRVRLAAADALLDRAGRFVDAAMAAPDEASVAAASVAVAEARAASHRAGLLAANKLLELGGTSATDRADNLDRYWRDVRVHTLHDPVRWKYHWIGAWHLTGRIPPRHGAL